MKRLLILMLIISAGITLTVAQVAVAATDTNEPQFFRAKAGLLVSPGLIRLIRKEGEVSLDDERITCHRTRKTGSHMKETFCMTNEEAELARKRNQRTFWRFLQGIQR